MSRLGRLFARKRMEIEFDKELRFHFESQVEDKVRSGIPESEARRLTRIEFGGIEQVKQLCREARGVTLVETLVQDVRYALRGFCHNPMFSIAVVLTLMLGIGSTSAVFSVVDRILFRPLPYRDSDRLVSVGLVAPIEPQEFMLGGSYYEWQDNQKPFVAMTSETGVEPCDLTEVNPLRLDCARVENNFLPTLGIAPVVGRNFLPSEDRPNAPSVALISYSLWRSRFHMDRNVAGKVIRIDEKPTEIVGVLPRDFEMPRLQSADVLMPESLDVAAQRRANPGRPMWAFARLKPGGSPEQAKAQLESLFEYSLQQAPAPFRKEVHLTVRPLRDRQFRDVHRAAWILLGLVAAVLLIACANVASLQIARRSGREREMAVRAALGAGRMRLLQQTLTESFILSGVGAVAGVIFAAILLRVFVAIAPEGMPFLSAARIDLRVLLLALCASLICASGFGLVAGLSRTRADALTTRTQVSRRHAQARQVLVTVQIAAGLLLLAGGGLLAQSFFKLQRQNLGMNYQNVLTATISLGQTAYPKPERQMSFFNQLEHNLRYGPGVSLVAISDSLPPGGYHHDTLFASLRVEGRARSTTGTGGNVAWRWVTPDYFRALDIPLIEGNGFTDDELGSSDRFVVLSNSLAQRMFPGQDPLRQQVHLSSGAPADQDPPYTVVGVAAEVKNGGLATGEEPEYYRLRRNKAEDWDRRAVMIVKSNLPASTMLPWMRQQIAALDPTLPVETTTLQERVAKLADQPRFEMLLVAYFAFTGLALAIVGLYGVTSFLMVQRKPEIGLRMALGASKGNIVQLVLRDAMRMVLPGTVIGLALALALSRIWSSMLFQVGPRDPATFLCATVLLGVVAVLAALVPAAAATRVDPVAALRVE
jgi:putative ABC transport system permease protein